MYVDKYTYIYVYIHVHIHIYTCMYIYICMYRTHLKCCIYKYTYIHVCSHIKICTYCHVYANTPISTYVYTHSETNNVHIHLHDLQVNYNLIPCRTHPIPLQVLYNSIWIQVLLHVFPTCTHDQLIHVSDSVT